MVVETLNLVEEKVKQILNQGVEQRVIGVLANGEKLKLRIFKSSYGNYCYKAPHKQRYGYPINTLKLIDILPEFSKKHKSDEQIWRDSWTKVKERLEKSGLWQDMLQDVITALNVGYEKLKEAEKSYWQDVQGVKYEANEILRTKRIQEIDERLVRYNKEKQCFFANTSIIWYMHHPAKVKKMRFSKSTTYNEEILKRITIAIQDRKDHHESGRTNYDISFEYSYKKGNKAWYSEEFKNCGNGHYYLALDATHALFYEDD